ncbi:hypothetical protein PEX1_010030 [Penicillium expansum]|uniref:Uncharacterized protein n=1 Tax=Penicillium expansum TaxID=27334 RepID=A0A0A2IBQ0_PENEN|nr:hypothetical protein PEX2_080880 [Penicillium expansum]KGO39831.1 hypothetical protein PEXP_032460 [Penicillium expansum]KGO61234.1 hypothetical protein PEX2_080880 [Penicillium expansum]KGO67718.1 hypothetical protein PEX1_010030 [Penicillium expansum]
MSSPSQSSSYDEETIVTQITTIYNLLVKLSYFSSDQVTFPPEGGHSINEELCHSLHIAPLVISLMKKIPYVVDGYHKPIMWQSRAFEYLLDEEIRNGRDPELTGVADDDGLRLDFLRPWEVALTCWLDDGSSVILDTKSNIIRLIDESEPPEDDFREETEAHNAPAYLQKVIDDIQTLEMVYFPGGDIGYLHLPGSWEQTEVKRILTENFGWGAEFREEDWRREGEEICKAIGDEGLDREEERQRDATPVHHTW